jgi:hypothetical protein
MIDDVKKRKIHDVNYMVLLIGLQISIEVLSDAAESINGTAPAREHSRRHSLLLVKGYPCGNTLSGSIEMLL